jgi:hypothetical protein
MKQRVRKSVKRAKAAKAFVWSVRTARKVPRKLPSDPTGCSDCNIRW